MDHADALRTILSADAIRSAALHAVSGLGLPDCWIGAGFIRNAVWDHLHGRPPSLSGDADVVWYCPERAHPSHDHRLEAALRSHAPSIVWSVKNQARMHRRNDDLPYASTADAMRHWPETATAVAVRLTTDGYEIATPFGLDDLFAMLLRPTPRFAGDKLPIHLDRLRTRQWLRTWPLLRLADARVEVDPPRAT